MTDKFDITQIEIRKADLIEMKAEEKTPYAVILTYANMHNAVVILNEAAWSHIYNYAGDIANIFYVYSDVPTFAKQEILRFLNRVFGKQAYAYKETTTLVGAEAIVKGFEIEYEIIGM